MSGGSFLTGMAGALVLVSGWRAMVIAMMAGAASALALAPFHLFPILFVTFPILVLLLDGAAADRGRSLFGRLLPAFARGYWFGFGYFVAGLWWMGSAFLVNAELFAWALPLAVVGLPLGLAIFFGLAAAIARLAWRDDWLRIVFFAGALAFTEWLRSTILTGFPWNHLGQMLAANEVMMQGLSFAGLQIYGLLAVLIFASPAALFDRSVDDGRSGFKFTAVGVSLLVVVCGFGFLRLQTAETRFVENVQMRIVQPNIRQKDKFKPELAGPIMRKYLEMSARSTGPGDLGLLKTTHLIWPESAFPFLLTEQPDVIAAIADLLPPGTTLLTGAVRADPKQAGRKRTYYNALYTINHKGEIVDAYDKVHLVPFGEYLPFQKFLESVGIFALIETPGGFRPGLKRRVVTAANAPAFLPLICYEVIFSGQSERLDENSPAPEWILNITNDAWFGLTTGPHQHYHQTRLRAVEDGLPVIRAANNGISAVIDPFGRALKFIKLNGTGLIDSKLPVKVAILTNSVMKSAAFWCLIGIIALLYLRQVAGVASSRRW